VGDNLIIYNNINVIMDTGTSLLLVSNDLKSTVSNNIFPSDLSC